MTRLTRLTRITSTSEARLSRMDAAAGMPVALPPPSLPPSLIGRVIRAVTALWVPLAPEHRSASDVSGALVRLGRWLNDEDWAVTVDGTTLYAVKHPGVLYRTLSVPERGTRGALVCWLDTDRMDRVGLRFRPDWLSAAFDAGVLGLCFATTRGLEPRSRWVDAVVVPLVFALVLPMLMPLARLRLVTVLTRAVLSSDGAWEDVLFRGGLWRGAWNVVGGGLLTWLLLRWTIPVLWSYESLAARVAPGVYRFNAWAGVKLFGSAVGALIAICLIWYVVVSSIRTDFWRD